jgi:hypothetical protein
MPFPVLRRKVLPRFFPAPLSIILVLLAGCTGPRIESAHFGPSADVERAMRLYYERHASEGGASCFRPYIDGFSRLDVVEDTPDRLVIETRYFFRDRAQESGPGGGNACVGFNQRTFTLGRDQDGRPVVTNMTGEQYEPAIRSLIRRMLPD